jgi:hypothetical protein
MFRTLEEAEDSVGPNCNGAMQPWGLRESASRQRSKDRSDAARGSAHAGEASGLPFSTM